MPSRSRLSASVLLLTLAACAKPESAPESFTVPAKTADAGRLRMDPRTFTPPLELFAEGVSGSLEVRLEVDPDGRARAAHKVAGSNPLWFKLRNAVLGMRFHPARPEERGPWEVFMVFRADSSAGGGVMEARATGSSRSTGSFRMEIVDVRAPGAPARP